MFDSFKIKKFFIVKYFVNLLCHVQEEDLEEEDEEELEETLTVTDADATAIGEEDSASKSPPPSSASPPRWTRTRHRWQPLVSPERGFS